MKHNCATHAATCSSCVDANNASFNKAKKLDFFAQFTRFILVGGSATQYESISRNQ